MVGFARKPFCGVAAGTPTTQLEILFEGPPFAGSYRASASSVCCRLSCLTTLVGGVVGAGSGDFFVGVDRLVTAELKSRQSC